jgi:hypothetical protein
VDICYLEEGETLREEENLFKDYNFTKAEYKALGEKYKATKNMVTKNE